MGFLQRLSTARPLPMRAGVASDYNRAFWAGDPLPDLWLSALASSGVTVSPEQAMTLSAFYCAVTTIGYDLATLPPVTFKARDDGGKDRVPALPGDLAAGAIGDLAYKLRWQPNAVQTSTEFFLSMIAQFLMRSVAYAEIVNGPRGWLDQLLPRHPDRIRAERLPSGRLRYRLEELNGGPRYLTQDEMFVVRDLSYDGATVIPRVAFATQSLGTIIAAEKAAGKFFRSGMTAATVATYTGDLDDEDEQQLHASISRYAAGVENSFGLMLVPDNVSVKNLAIEPDKAQMMLAREWGVFEVARLFRIPAYKLQVKGTATYASQVQSALDYVIGCLRPTAVTFEQAIQRDLVLEKGSYFVEFLLDALMRGDPSARAAYYEKAIQNRWMRPSEVRLAENMNPDAALDTLSESDHRPGSSVGGAAPASQQGPGARMLMQGFLALRDHAERCCRRERAAVEKLARKHANDPAGWQAGLREFYGEHAGFVAQTMRIPLAIARGYAAQHGSEFEAKGVIIIDGDAGEAWEREEADALASLAVDRERIAA